MGNEINSLATRQPGQAEPPLTEPSLAAGRSTQGAFTWI